jgi:hypothetical protein
MGLEATTEPVLTDVREPVAAQLDQRTAAEHGPDRRHRVLARRRVLAVYAVSRLALLLDAVAIGIVEHRPLAGGSGILSTWDGSWYLSIASSGYPSQVLVHKYSSVAFFPLYPLLGRGLAVVTRLPVDWTLVLVSWIGGAALVWMAVELVADRYGTRRGQQAAIVLAVFPGSVVLGLTYADGLAVAFACASLLALERQRHLLAGLAGCAAATTLSAFCLPVMAALAVAAAVRRDGRALAAALLVPAGAVAFFVYLWVHTGSPLTWWRVQHGAWRVHLSLPIDAHTGTTQFAFSTPGIATLTALSAALALASLYALYRCRAPAPWIVFTLVVLVTVNLDGTNWMAPRFVFDAFPGVLAIGAVLPQRVVRIVAVVGLLVLMLVLADYAPANRVFLNP